MEGTLITLVYSQCNKERSTNDVAYLIKKIEDSISDKRGLKIHTCTDFGEKGRVHHHVLVNRKIELKLIDEWKEGYNFADHIKSDYNYADAVKYVMQQH